MLSGNRGHSIHRRLLCVMSLAVVGSCLLAGVPDGAWADTVYHKWLPPKGKITSVGGKFVKHDELVYGDLTVPRYRIESSKLGDKKVGEVTGDHNSSNFDLSDDMPADINGSLTGFDLTLPVRDGRLHLGTWQGIYLCEHRDHGGPRSLTATIWGETA